MNTEDIKINICREDFYVMLEEAYQQAGGGIPIPKIKSMPFDEVVNVLAQNGLRMVYLPDKHLDSLELVWKKTKLDHKTVHRLSF